MNSFLEAIASLCLINAGTGCVAEIKERLFFRIHVVLSIQRCGRTGGGCRHELNDSSSGYENHLFSPIH